MARGTTVKSEAVIAEARALRDQGKLLRELAEHFGVAVSTVNAWLKDPDGTRLAARKRSLASACERCDAPNTGRASGRGSARLCLRCGRRQGSALGGAATADAHRELRETIIALWGQGVEATEIGERVGLTERQVRRRLLTWRHRGYKVPYRYDQSRVQVARIARSLVRL